MVAIAAPIGWVLVAGLLGCGGANSASVAGVVTLDGKPLDSGSVSFYPQDSAGAPAYGQIDSQGRYSLSTGTDAGLMAGKYTAVVVATKPPPQPLDRNGAELPPIPITPTKYCDVSTSDLKPEVKAGRNQIPLELKSAGGSARP